MARGAALTALAQASRLRGEHARRSALPRVQVLLLHHLFPDEESNFRKLLSRLSASHAFLGYSEAVERAAAGGTRIDRPYLAFTFDDGFKNCLRAAAILKEFGARACFFICPTIVGEPDREKVASFCRDRLELPRPVEFMDCDDLARLKAAGHEIGGHTMTHPHLNRLAPQQAIDEIGDCFKAVRKEFGEAKHFAWTYGRFADFNASLAQEVFRAGFVSCASGERGCHGPRRADAARPLIIRRDHVVAGWPIGHSLHLIAQAAGDASSVTGEWPAAWDQRG